MKSICPLILLVLSTACGDERRSRSAAVVPGEDGSQAGSPSSRESDAELLCDRIEDDEALIPPAGVTVDMPDLASLNGERRCVLVFGVDMPHEDVRQFARSALADLGYEIADWVEGEGIVQGNLGRTFVRATKPGLHANLTIDEFDPEETALSEHRIQVKMQFDAVS